MKKILSALVISAMLGGVNQVSAAPLFMDDFEGGNLNNWSPNAFGQIVQDPLDALNKVLNFTNVNAAGDIFSSSLIALTSGQKYSVSFDFYGVSGNDSSSGGFAGLANGTPGTHVWYAGTKASALSTLTPAAIVLLDDIGWYNVAYTFTAPLVPLNNMVRLMFEDFRGSGSIAGNAYFDNVEFSAVPLPAALPLFAGGLGLLGLLGWRRKRMTA